MEKARERKPEQVIPYILMALSVILALLLFFFVVQYRKLRHEEIISAHEAAFDLFLKHRPPLTADDTELIQSWMTFDYVNRIFGLPSDYLKTELQISDASYPRMTISGYVSRHHLDSKAVISQIQDDIKKYLTPKST